MDGHRFGPVAAVVDHGKNGKDDEASNGDDEVPDCSFRKVPFVSGADLLVNSAQVSLGLCLPFRIRHGTKFKVRKGKGEDHEDGQDGIHIERNSGKECGQFIGKRACFKKGGAYGGSPARNRCDDADRSGRRINDVG